MTRKDYIAIAEALRAEQSTGIATEDWNYARDCIAGRIAYQLSKDNPRFDREHFLAVVRGERDLNSRPTRPPGEREKEVRS